MRPSEPVRRPYSPPGLAIYGDLASITQSATTSTNKNDSTQGQNNLKT